jgi:hypothetical protein
MIELNGRRRRLDPAHVARACDVRRHAAAHHAHPRQTPEARPDALAPHVLGSFAMFATGRALCPRVRSRG